MLFLTNQTLHNEVLTYECNGASSLEHDTQLKSWFDIFGESLRESATLLYLLSRLKWSN